MRRDHRLLVALRRARWPILASAGTYLGSLGLGIALVSAGWTFATSQRDAIVSGARASPITVANNQGDHLTAALLDFGSNTVLGALPTSITGLTVIGPFPIAAYRGWVGGIVSVDADHNSRLASPSTAIYYLVTIALQLTGFILTMAAGVHVGWSAWKARHDPSVRSLAGFRIPGFALWDAAYLYMVAIPAFLAGSLFEFLA